MGTDNPKVSAYVPQALKERLKEFRKEHDSISESQAVIIILAEYFQMPEVLGRSPEGSQVGGVTIARMEALEERLVDFTASVEHRLQQLGEEIRKIGELSVVHQVTPNEIISEQDNSLPSEPQVVEEVVEKVDELPIGNQDSEQVVTVGEIQVGSLPIELPSALPKQDGEGEKLEASQEVDNSSLSSELLTQDRQEAEDQVLVENRRVDSNKSKPELSLLSEPIDNLISKPLSGKVMAKRLGYHPDSLSKVKTKATDEGFLVLSADKDPDGIAWKPAKKGRGYLPANELSSELQTKLLSWLKENFPDYSL